MVSTWSGRSVTSDPGTLISATVSITASSYIVKQSAVTYTLSFLNLDAIPVSGYIVLGIPVDIPASTSVNDINSNCAAAKNSGSVSSTPCTAIQNTSGIFVTFTSIFSSAAAAAGSNITLQIISSLTNPPSTKAVSSFSIQTYDGQGYLIDQLLTGLSITMATAAPFNSLSVSSLSRVNSAITSYTFTFNQPSSMDSGGSIVIVFPTNVVPQSGATCTDGSSNPLTCTALTGQSMRITLPAIPVNSDFVVKISAVKNGPSLKPSGPFKLTTFASDAVSKYSEDSSTLTITNSEDSVIPSLNYTFTPMTYGTAVDLSIVFTPTNSSIGYVYVTLAPDFVLTSVSCTASSYIGITGGSCTASSNIVNVTGTFSTSSNIGVTITGFKAPKAASSQVTTIRTFDNSGSGFEIDTYSAIAFTTLCTMPCMECLSASPTVCVKCYTDTTITPKIYLDVANSNCV